MRSRIVALGSVSALVLVSMGFGLAAPAAAITDPNGLAAAQALNVPGTVLTGAAAGGLKTYTEGELAGLLASKMKFNWSWTKDAMLSKFSGNTTVSPPPTSGLTPAQVATLDQTAAQLSAPATKLATVAKTVGGAVTAISVGTSGIALGVAVDQAFGVDVAGGLCAAGGLTGVNAVLAGITGTDCQKWQMSQALQAAPNTDVTVVGITGPAACSSTGVCFAFAGQSTFTENWAGGSQVKGEFACAVFSGNPPATQTNAYGPMITAPSSYYGPGPMVSLTGGAFQGVGMLDTETYSYNGVSGPVYPLRGRCGSSTWAWVAEGSSTTPGTLPSVASYGWGTQASDGSLSWQSTTTPATASSIPANPQRQFKCVVAFQSGGSATAYTANFTEGGATAVPSPVCPAVPPSEVPTTTTIYETGPSGDIQLFQQPTTPEYQNWKATYPECANGSCLLDLRKSSVSCFSNAAPCDGWMSDPNRDTLYACWYGTHSVPLSQCYVYAPTFTPSKVAAGTPYADPATGTSTGVQTAPVEGGAMDKPVNDPANAPRQCWPTGWGQMNPLAWVLQPLQCGLTWAFVPSQPQVDAQLQKVQTAWSTTPMVQLATVVTGWHFTIAMTGCKGPGVPIVYGTKTYDTWYPLNACDQPMAFWAGVCSTAVNLAFIILGGLAITRHIGGIVQYGGLGGRES